MFPANRIVKMILVIAVASNLACIYAAGAASATDSVEKTLPLQAGGSFSLENVNGGVTLSVWDRPEVHFKATKKSRAANDAMAKEGLQKTDIVVTASATEIKVETRYPKKPAGSWFGHGNSVSVEYEIQVPAGTRLSLSTVNGSVNADAKGCALSCETVNGALDLKGADSLKAESVNGRITFDTRSVESVETTNGRVEGFLTGPQKGSGRVETVNGSVQLSLGKDLSATLQAENVNGSLDCSLPGFSVQKHSASGTIGAGGPTISVETVNGRITLGNK